MARYISRVFSFALSCLLLCGSALANAEDQEIIALAKKIYPPRSSAGISSPLRLAGECGQIDLMRLNEALANPEISAATRAAVDQIVAAAKPVFESSHQTAHFDFQYTKISPDAADNATD